MPVPSNTNVSHKIFEELSKYKNLEIVITKMWHLKTTTLPVVVVVLGMAANTVPNYVMQIHRAQPLTKLQKITLTLIGTARIL